jgi:hypothetical protein
VIYPGADTGLEDRIQNVQIGLAKGGYLSSATTALGVEGQVDHSCNPVLQQDVVAGLADVVPVYRYVVDGKGQRANIDGHQSEDVLFTLQLLK